MSAHLPAHTWRRAVWAVLLLAQTLALLCVFAFGASMPWAEAAVLLALTVAAGLRPGGALALAALGWQVLMAQMLLAPPRSVAGWALVVGYASAVVATHLVLTLLASWSPDAAVPVATLHRWGRGALVLTAVSGAGAGVAMAAQRVDALWGGYVLGVGFLALLAVVGVIWWRTPTR